MMMEAVPANPWAYCRYHDCEYMVSEGCDECRDAAFKRKREAEEVPDDDEPLPTWKQVAIQERLDRAVLDAADSWERNAYVSSEYSLRLAEAVRKRREG